MSRTTKYGQFGASVSAALAERQLSQADLAEALGRSRAYLNQTMTGTKPASAEWADLVADALKLSRAKRAELHDAAARDHGLARRREWRKAPAVACPLAFRRSPVRVFFHRNRERSSMEEYDPFARGAFSVGVRTVELRDAARARTFPCEIWMPKLSVPQRTASEPEERRRPDAGGDDGGRAPFPVLRPAGPLRVMPWRY